MEFSLVLPLFLLGFFGLIDGARLVYLNSTLSQAAREGARLGAVQAFWMGRTESACGTTGGPTCPASFDILRNNVLSAANRMMTTSRIRERQSPHQLQRRHCANRGVDGPVVRHAGCRVSVSVHVVRPSNRSHRCWARSSAASR